jgi:hypothetical protein
MVRNHSIVFSGPSRLEEPEGSRPSASNRIESNESGTARAVRWWVCPMHGTLHHSPCIFAPFIMASDCPGMTEPERIRQTARSRRVRRINSFGDPSFVSRDRANRANRDTLQFGITGLSGRPPAQYKFAGRLPSGQRTTPVSNHPTPFVPPVRRAIRHSLVSLPAVSRTKNVFQNLIIGLIEAVRRKSGGFGDVFEKPCGSRRSASWF